MEDKWLWPLMRFRPRILNSCKMCEITNQLKFCTCLDEKAKKLIDFQKGLAKLHKKQLQKSNEQFIWILYEYKGRESDDWVGLVALPSDKIGQDLTEDFVLNQINEKDCFDFLYKPEEGDNLRILSQRENRSEYLSFIYRNNKWVRGWYSSLTDIFDAKNYGILKVDK